MALTQRKIVDLGNNQSLGVITATMMVTALGVTARDTAKGAKRERKRRIEKSDGVRNERIEVEANEEEEDGPILPRPLRKRMHRSRLIPRHRQSRIREGKRKVEKAKNEKGAKTTGVAMG